MLNLKKKKCMKSETELLIRVGPGKLCLFKPAACDPN